MANLHDTGICVRHWDWSETSQTVSILTHQHGLIRGLAKGAKREKGTFSGGIELLTRGQVLGLTKARSDLITLTSWDLLEPYRGLRSSLGAFHAGMFLADLVLSMISDRDPHPGVYEALEQSLNRLGGRDERPSSILRIVLQMQWTVLAETGTKPDLESDILSGQTLASDAVLVFVPGHGGFTRDGGDGWRVRRTTLEVLQKVSRISPDTPETWEQADCERAVRLLGAYVEFQTGRAFRALSPLLQVVCASNRDND